MIDVSLVRPGVKVRAADGQVYVVKGSYMSTTGIVITGKAHPGQFGETNLPIETITEVIKENE